MGLLSLFVIKMVSVSAGFLWVSGGLCWGLNFCSEHRMLANISYFGIVLELWKPSMNSKTFSDEFRRNV